MNPFETSGPVAVGFAGLTEKETIALRDLFESARGNGFDFGFTDEIPSLPAASRGGVVASLVEKELIDVYDATPGNESKRKRFVQFTFRAAFWARFGIESEDGIHPAREAIAAWTKRGEVR
jgi:hypothetical protein